MNKNFKNYQHKSFLQDISQVPWSAVDCFDNIEHSHNAFNLLFKEVLDEHTPKKKKKMKLLSRPNLYITDKVRELMKIREYWRKLARRTGDPDAWMKYRSLKRKVKREIRQTERESIADQVKRSCIPKKSTSQRSFSRDDKTVADEFNRFFTSVGHADKINSLVLSM